MPVAGFKPGDPVLTPSGKRALVIKVVNRHPEKLMVRYVEAGWPSWTTEPLRVFWANALRKDYSEENRA